MISPTGVAGAQRARQRCKKNAAAEVATERTPERDAERDSDLAHLTHLTARLPDRERELIALKYGAELNNRMIARLIGVGESNVGTILHRTVQGLRARWHTAGQLHGRHTRTDSAERLAA